jgi:SdpC family antimicrobial peptide
MNSLTSSITGKNVLSILCVILVGFQSFLPTFVLGQPPQQRTRYDGETIFRGLYFGRGPVAELFPEIWKQERFLERKKLLTPEEERRIAEIQDKIIARIREKDNGFFDRFQRAMQSSDHLTIQKNLDEATALTLSVVRQETGKDPSAPIVDSAGVYRWVQIWEYFYVYYFYFVYEFVFAFLYFSPAQAEGVAAMKGITRLQREEWINLIATRLAAKEGQ